MAAATVATGYPVRNVAGAKVHLHYKLTTPADGDTLLVPLTSIDIVHVAFSDASTAAADATSVTWSGSTITFKVVGTARTILVTVIGN